MKHVNTRYTMAEHGVLWQARLPGRYLPGTPLATGYCPPAIHSVSFGGFHPETRFSYVPYSRYLNLFPQSFSDLHHSFVLEATREKKGRVFGHRMVSAQTMRQCPVCQQPVGLWPQLLAREPPLCHCTFLAFYGSVYRSVFTKLACHTHPRPKLPGQGYLSVEREER